MNRIIYRGLFIFGGVACLAACQKAQSPVIAQVGKEQVTLDDLKARLASTPAEYQQYVTTEDGRRQFLDLLIREKILLGEAKSLGIQHDLAYRDAVRKYRTDAQRQLKEYENTLLVDSALRRMRSTNLAVTDTEVEKYYNDHLSDYEHPVLISASHILLPDDVSAERALDKVRAGIPFDKVARLMSKDPATAEKGGRLAPFRHGNFLPELDDAVFPLKNGQVSEVVKSQFGFHIIKKLGEKKLPPLALADVKEEIRARLERDKFNQWVAAKQAVLGVKVDEQAMSHFSLEDLSKP